jgi:hypothetical protein
LQNIKNCISYLVLEINISNKFILKLILKMKLFIQIPCYNEEKTLLSVLQEIPKEIDWINEIKIQIIDDWSSDNTIKVAEEFWVNYIVKHIWNKWLWEAFKSWVENALINWADIVVNTDWDNQYPWKYITALILPIVEKKADLVIWDRQTRKIEHFSIVKKFFQWFWSFMVRFLSWTKVPDSVSWFRAYSRESLLRLNVTSSFSYAVDTLVQAWSKWLKIDYILMTTNKPTRKSRLFKNIFDHMYKTSQILIRVYAMYNPLKIFFNLWLIFTIFWTLWIWRFIYFYIQYPENTWKIQSLTISVTFLIIAVQFFALWIIW